MAIPSTTVWEVRQTATAGNVNGGGFNSARGGTDYTQQDAAQLALSDLTTSGAGSTTLSSVTGGFTSQMVGNIIYIASGTNFQVGSYEVVTFTDSNNVVLDRTPTSGGAGSVGVGKLGGAKSMNSTLDDDWFEELVGGNIVYVKYSSTAFALGESISVASSSGTNTAPVFILGYNTTRGDNPTGSNRPLFNFATQNMNLNNMIAIVRNIAFTGTPATLVVSPALGGTFENCKFLNTSSTAARTALSLSAEAFAIGCEACSLNGVAIAPSTNSVIMDSYIHDSDKGIAGAFARVYSLNNIFEANTTADIELSSTTGVSKFISNTFYGREGKIGIGINILGATNPGNRILNNIFYGKATAISIATLEQKSNISFKNTFFNNTTNATNYTLGDTDLTSDPSFTAATQVTGTTATTSGSVLTQSGGDFSSVTDNVDVLHVLSGTGVTVGKYLITSHTGTTLTVNNALGTSSGGDVVYFVTTGHNFGVGTNMKAAAYQMTNTGSESNSYLDIGAVQRIEPAAGGGGGGYAYSN